MVAVEAEVAKAAQTKMADVVASIKDVLGKINGTVSDAERVFQGDAAKAFQDAAAEWHTSFGKMNTALDQMQGQVGQGTDVFTNVDTDNQAEFKKALTNLA